MPVPEGTPVERHPLLRVAQQRVAEDVAAWAGEAVNAEEAAAHLECLVEAVQLGAAEQLKEGKTVGTAVLRRRLLDLLRRELLTAAEEAPSSMMPELLPLLTALEAVSEGLEPDWREYFGSSITGAYGHELIVEVAHDFRSPLTSIMFLAETIRKGQSGPVTEQQRHQLGIMYSAALALAGVASDVIETVRGGDTLADQEPHLFSIREVLETLQDLVRPMAEEKGLALQIVPPKGADSRLGHPGPISRTLLNLTTNAIKFTDEGFVEVFATEQGRHRVQFSVRDTGRGVNAEAVRTLYHPFRRTPGKRGFNFSGTGLGLAICRKMVEAMGSELHLESRPDWGTRFWFDLVLPPA